MKKVAIEQILDAIKATKVIEDVESLKHDVELSEQGVDSLDLSNMLLGMEDAFGIEIPDEDIDALLTINDILEYVNGKI